MHRLYTRRTNFKQGLHMGKGDRRTRRGKIYNGSYGKKRPNRLKPKSAPAAPSTPQPVRSGRAR
jgi:30S ribosomal protein S31